MIADPIQNARYMYDVYTAAEPSYSGRVTVPVLWDRARRTIVNNESSDILRMFNSALNGVGAAQGDYFPNEWRDEIEAINSRVYDTLNNGVYKPDSQRRKRPTMRP